MIYNDEDNKFCDTGCLFARPRFQALFQSTIASTGQFLDGRAKKCNKNKVLYGNECSIFICELYSWKICSSYVWPEFVSFFISWRFLMWLETVFSTSQDVDFDGS